jgi:hypothetical protein
VASIEEATPTPPKASALAPGAIDKKSAAYFSPRPRAGKKRMSTMLRVKVREAYRAYLNFIFQLA